MARHTISLEVYTNLDLTSCDVLLFFDDVAWLGQARFHIGQPELTLHCNQRARQAWQATLSKGSGTFSS